MQYQNILLLQSLHQKAVCLEKSLSETLKKLKRYREKQIFDEFMVIFFPNNSVHLIVEKIPLSR